MATIHISNDPSGCIIVSFPYDPLLVSKVKTIAGRRWHPAEKHWSFPKLDGMLERILKVFGDENFQIDPVLQAKFLTLKGSVPDFVVSAQPNDLRTDNHSIPPLEKWDTIRFPPLTKGARGDLNRDCPRSLPLKTCGGSFFKKIYL